MNDNDAWDMHAQNFVNETLRQCAGYIRSHAVAPPPGHDPDTIRWCADRLDDCVRERAT